MRKAKNPDDNCKWSRGGQDNQSVLNKMIVALDDRSDLGNTFNYVDTGYGYNFWSEYKKDGNERGKKVLLKLIEELAIPLKPINKEKWL